MNTTKLKVLSLFIVMFVTSIAIYFMYCHIASMYRSNNIYSTPVDLDLETIVDVANSCNDTVTDIYYINLAKSKDRNRSFLSKLDDTINPIRVDAVSPQTLPEIKKPFKCFTIFDTEYACLASHLKAIHTAYHDNKLWAIIAEDDAVIKQNVDWRKLIASAPADWQLLQIHTCCIPKTENNQNTIIQHFHNDSNLWIESNDIVASAAFYIINRSGMYNLISRFVVDYEQSNWDDIETLDLRSSEVNCQADLLLFKGIKRYICTYSFIGIDTSNNSTIATSHTYWNDYSHYK